MRDGGLPLAIYTLLKHGLHLGRRITEGKMQEYVRFAGSQRLRAVIFVQRVLSLPANAKKSKKKNAMLAKPLGCVFTAANR